MIQLREVRKEYAGTPVILDRVSLAVEAGEQLAVIGPSGSGKSTLLNIIGGLDKPDSGTVEVDATKLDQLNERELARFRCNTVGFVFQLHHLLPQYSVLDNVLLPTLAPDGRKEGARKRAAGLLDRVGMADKAKRQPAMLSGGERQRVAVARALINQPKLLLADEPTGSLSHEGAERLTQLLLELCSNENMTLVTVTHSAELAASMGRRLQLRDGKLTHGTTETDATTATPVGETSAR
jgi:ABC-type lipoprotein export system ATPase subunit